MSIDILKDFLSPQILEKYGVQIPDEAGDKPLPPADDEAKPLPLGDEDKLLPSNEESPPAGGGD